MGGKEKEVRGGGHKGNNKGKKRRWKWEEEDRKMRGGQRIEKGNKGRGETMTRGKNRKREEETMERKERKMKEGRRARGSKQRRGEGGGKEDEAKEAEWVD